MTTKYFIVLSIVFQIVSLYFFNKHDFLSNSNLNSIYSTDYNQNQNCKDTSKNFKSYPLELDDSCVVANKIRKTIIEYIKNDDVLIYEDDFISSFSKINKYDWKCYFPRNNEEVVLYFYLGDSILIKKSTNDQRATRLAINLYLINSNNAELSEYYGYYVIPKIAVENILFFVQVLSEHSDKEIDKCVYKLNNIENEDEIDNIKKELIKIKDTKYAPIICKIETILSKN